MSILEILGVVMILIISFFVISGITALISDIINEKIIRDNLHIQENYATVGWIASSVIASIISTAFIFSIIK